MSHHSQLYDSHKLLLYQSLFRGRTDVFAIYWEKGGKKGYMPAYDFDPYMYRIHKANGGTFNTYKDKTFKALTPSEIERHLTGDQLIGIYPLLQDNTTWFLAADFDKKNWLAESRRFVNACKEKQIPAYLERSKSGKGGHVWIFLEEPVQAYKIRKVVISILEKLKLLSTFDKNSSFDRLFPNQDAHSGKGLGNLIALPLYKPAWDKGNSCFIDEENSTLPNQWEFLANVQKVSAIHVDELFQTLARKEKSPTPFQASSSTELPILLDNAIRIPRSRITPALKQFLREELNLTNSEFFIKKNAGKKTWGTQRFFNLIGEKENEVVLPRGFIGKLLRYCQRENIAYHFQDERKKLTSITFQSTIHLLEHQKLALASTSKKDFGVIAAPPGSGKTIIGLKIIEEKKQPSLIIVHRKQILEQWMERIQTFLGIPKKDIGIIGSGKLKIGEAITVAMILSLGKAIQKEENQDIINHFGTVILDECHHIPAKSFRETISQLRPYYQYGLTATPFRKGSDGKLIFLYLGEKIAEIKPEQIESYKAPQIIIRKTTFDVPFNPKTDEFETLSAILIHDTSRNNIILHDIKYEISRGNKLIIITERVDHIRTLYQHLKSYAEVITLSGQDTEKNRKIKWRELEAGRYQVLLTTGQFLGEGTDLPNASCLFLAYPFSFKGKLIQYMGRVQRSELTPTIYDYRDPKIDYLEKLFLKRNTYYREIQKRITLTYEEENPEPQQSTFTFEKEIKIPIEELTFLYGAVSFSHLIPQLGSEIEFQLENDHIRPEWEVLKPYFGKIYPQNRLSISVQAEFEEGKLVSQQVVSQDIDRINQEIIESVKFQFVQKAFWGKNSLPQQEGLQHLESSGEQITSLFQSEEELFNHLLNHKEYLHGRNLRYLANRHEHTLLKLRFIIKPFAFVFLLSGEMKYHIILETLDTEEATYIWHIPKQRDKLSQYLSDINVDLNFIKNYGRKAFLENYPEDFSRIAHDYADSQKGFILWKGLLEERLV